MNKIHKLLAMLISAVMLVGTIPTMAFAAEGDYITRGEVVNMLLAAADDYNTGVGKSDIIKGRGDGKLDEDSYITRAEALVMLSRAFGKLPSLAGDNARSAYPYLSFTDLPDWSISELDNILRAGIVAGTTDTTLSPDDKVTYKQMKLFISRIYALEGTNLKDDFYATVNKNFLDSSVIQEGYSGTSNFMDLGIKANNDVAVIIREIAEGDAKTEGEKKIATLYNNIIDVSGRNKEGIKPIQRYLDAIDSSKDLKELMNVRKDIYIDLDTSMLIGFGVMVDSKDSNQYILCFSVASPVLGKNGYDERIPAQKTAYMNYLTDNLKLIGKDAAEAENEAQLIWNAEKEISANSLSIQEMSDVDKIYNVLTLADIQKIFPNVDMTDIFNQTGFELKEKIIIPDVSATRKAAELFDEQHLDTLKAILRFEIASGLGIMLNEDFKNVSDKLQQEYAGVSGALSTEDTAAQYVQSLLSDYLGEAYVSRYFSKEAKTEAEQLVKDIISTYKNRVNNLTWMSESTKDKAIKKLDAMKLKIGYPDKWYDDLANTKLLTAKEGGSFFDNLIAIQKAYHKLSIQNQKNGVDKTRWAMNPYTVNACYDHVDNSIQFPAAILQKPFFDVNAKYEENLGGIGYIIAHEITHAFDNNGAKFDENGNATDWWTKEDYEKFQELCKKVVDLYDGRESAPGIVCNGELTLSENIADLGSAACITEIESKQPNPDYKTLYDSMTKVWRSSYPRAMKQYLQQNDLHSPDKLRGSLVFQNFETFYDAFGITKNDGMWLAPEKRVTIW